ncbi:MAG: hypothetical protein A2136_03955, partial [Chloroflexi bacterium RBG_16_54_11]
MNRFYRILLVIALGLGLVVALSLSFQSKQVVAQAGPTRAEVIQAAVVYLRVNQQADGGILGFSGLSDPDTTARTVLAFTLAGEPISEVVTGTGLTTLDYLSTQAISFTHDTTGTLFPGRAGVLLSAVALAGGNPADFGGMDLAGELQASLQPDTGAYSTTAQQDFSSGLASDLNQAWAILGLSLAGADMPEIASQFLIGSQAEDGSWGFGDPDTIALAVTALIATRQVSAGDQVIQDALQFFHTTQLPNGGWRPSWDTDPLNADSTGWILQALVSAGDDPSGDIWSKEQGNPIYALLSLQKPDGAIGGTYANTYSTAEAIIGLAGVSLSGSVSSPAGHQAGLAVFPGDGTVYTACVTFSEDNLTGSDFLQRSGLAIESASNPNQGTAVCKIGNVGCLSSSCFCRMPVYWSYWQLIEGAWAYSSTGADQSQVSDGDVNAWNWGSGDPPPLVSFKNICEGEPFVMPAATETSLPPTDAPLPTQALTLVPASTMTQPAATP